MAPRRRPVTTAQRLRRIMKSSRELDPRGRPDALESGHQNL